MILILVDYLNKVLLLDWATRNRGQGKGLVFKDKDLKIGPRGPSRTRTFLEDNDPATCTMNMQIRHMNIHKCHATHHEPAVINSINPETALDIHTDRHADKQMEIFSD